MYASTDFGCLFRLLGKNGQEMTEDPKYTGTIVMGTHENWPPDLGEYTIVAIDMECPGCGLNPTPINDNRCAECGCRVIAEEE